MSTETKKCPYCGELINVSAIKCKHCHEFLVEKANKEKNNNTMIGKIALSLLGLLFAIMAITNPSKEKHYEAVNNLIYGELNEGGNTESSLLSLGIALSGNNFSKLTEKIVKVNNYILFSTTSLALPGTDGKTIGIGIFGNVFLSKSNKHSETGNFDTQNQAQPEIEPSSNNDNIAKSEAAVLPSDFSDFIETFTANKESQLSRIRFPLTNSDVGKPAPDRSAWHFYEKKSFFEGITEDGKIEGHYKVINPNQISYSLGWTESDIEFVMKFEKINNSWMLVDYFDYDMIIED